MAAAGIAGGRGFRIASGLLRRGGFWLSRRAGAGSGAMRAGLAVGFGLWSLLAIRRGRWRLRLGISPQCLRRLLNAETKRVKVTVHASVCVLYGRLWNQLPSEATGRERRLAAMARAEAEAKGWPPPMALDDDRIDDPAYRPRTAWRRAAGEGSAGTR